MAHDAKHARAIRRIANTSGSSRRSSRAAGRSARSASARSRAQPRFDESDLAMAMELARRISLALDNARLFARSAGARPRRRGTRVRRRRRDPRRRGGHRPALEPDGRDQPPPGRPCEAVGRPIAELLGDWQSLQSRDPVAPSRRRAAPRARDASASRSQGEERWLSISAVRFHGGTVYAFRDLTDERERRADEDATSSRPCRTSCARRSRRSTARRSRCGAATSRSTSRSATGCSTSSSSEADRLARIVNDILSASRLDVGPDDVAIERCDAASVAREVVGRAAARGPRRGSSVVVGAPAGCRGRRATRTSCARCSRTCSTTRSSTRPTAAASTSRSARSGGRVRFRVARRGPRHPAGRAGADLREVLPARPGPDPRRRRQRPRPLHLPRARHADGRPHLGRLRRPTGSTFIVELRSPEAHGGHGR